jgi:hypothetical protein
MSRGPQGGRSTRQHSYFILFHFHIPLISTNVHITKCTRNQIDMDSVYKIQIKDEVGIVGLLVGEWDQRKYLKNQSTKSIYKNGRRGTLQLEDKQPEKQSQCISNRFQGRQRRSKHWVVVIKYPGSCTRNHSSSLIVTVRPLLRVQVFASFIVHRVAGIVHVSSPSL